ncbi:unnamed protein product [Ilex paraguariensis]|uniref:HPP transmembrane region domain-containing protein n=1 Tax=Ilex paraguariensis TaxID=185542 RepID=A0ABC8UQS6_9AQUA
MGMQLFANHQQNQLLIPPKLHKLSHTDKDLVLYPFHRSNGTKNQHKQGKAFGLSHADRRIEASSSNNIAAPLWDDWQPEKGSKSPSLSDVLWPSAGAFAAMAVLGKMDQMLAPKGLSMTIAPLGAVCAVLFGTPSSPAARKYNMFMAQIGCAAIGVLSFSVLGPGWLARSTGLAAAIAFMICTRSIHPPAASLPLLFVDGAKLHHLNLWYTLFPGATACILLCVIQEMVLYLKSKFKF